MRKMNQNNRERIKRIPHRFFFSLIFLLQCYHRHVSQCNIQKNTLNHILIALHSVFSSDQSFFLHEERIVNRVIVKQLSLLLLFSWFNGMFYWNYSPPQTAVVCEILFVLCLTFVCMWHEPTYLTIVPNTFLF